tara:strand:- start:158 stop:2647 length:2490 start_codon:yes stop_codon:yes gene_type:complete
MQHEVSLIDKLTDDSINSTHFIELYENLSNSYADSKINIDTCVGTIETDDLCRYADIFSLSNKSEFRMLSYRIIVKLLGVSAKSEELGSIARSIFSKLGLFVSESMFDSNKHQLPFDFEINNLFKRDKQKLPFGSEILTDSQYEVFQNLQSPDSFSFSGPTSFGKSFLIRNYIYSCINDKDNVVVLVPTKVLIEEYINEIRTQVKRLGWDDVHLSRSAHSFSIDKVNVFVLTPERFNSFVYENTEITLNVLIVDEAHKLGDDDERSITSFKVIHEAKSKYPECKLVFSSPVISNPSVFLSSFQLDSKNAIEAIEGPVTQNLFFIDLVDKKSQYYNEISNNFHTHREGLNFDNLFDFVKHVTNESQSSLIYCSSKSSSVYDAVSFSENLPYLDDPLLISASKNIKDLIHEDYFLADLLLKGVAFHNADLPKSVRSIVESLYQSRNLLFLFCTSTLLEGVNLPTGNLFLRTFKTKKLVTNKNKLDFWNLAGRAGRYTKELDGNIFCIRDSDNSWGNISDLVKDKFDVKANTSALNKLERGRKIINVLNNGALNEDKQERIMDQIANMVLAEYIEKNGQISSSSLLSLVPKRFHRRLTNALEEKFNSSGIKEVPSRLFSIGHNISIERHINVLSDVKSNPIILSSIKDTYPLIERISQLYGWKMSQAQLARLYRIMQQWTHGFALREIIGNSIDNTKTVKVGWNEPPEDFDRSNKEHVNIVINGVISTIETDIGYKLELYVNHYYQHLVSHIGSEGAGVNLSTFLELGTNDKYEIALQNYGFSRSVAAEINKQYRTLIEFDSENVVVSIDNRALLKVLDKSSIAYSEVKRMV